MSIPFHDISYVQGQYDMAANTDPMVMMKASGFYTASLVPYLDAQLDRNYALAKQYGKIPFMYHFFVPAADPITQAEYFLRAISPLAVGDGYALDVEIDDPDLVQKVLTFAKRHYANTGCYPWVYIDRYLRQKYDWSPVFSLCSEWIAAPDVPYSAEVPGVGVYVAQQGPIVNGVDTDEYFGTLESLKSYTYGYRAPAPSPQPAQEQPVNEPIQPTTPNQESPAASSNPGEATTPQPPAAQDNNQGATPGDSAPVATGGTVTTPVAPVTTADHASPLQRFIEWLGRLLKWR